MKAAVQRDPSKREQVSVKIRMQGTRETHPRSRRRASGDCPRQGWSRERVSESRPEDDKATHHVRSDDGNDRVPQPVGCGGETDTTRSNGDGENLACTKQFSRVHLLRRIGSPMTTHAQGPQVVAKKTRAIVS